MTVRLNCRVTFCCEESEAWAVNVKFPAVDAVPEMKPEGERLIPGGRFPPATAHCTGDCPPFVCSAIE